MKQMNGMRVHGSTLRLYGTSTLRTTRTSMAIRNSLRLATDACAMFQPTFDHWYLVLMLLQRSEEKKTELILELFSRKCLLLRLSDDSTYKGFSASGILVGVGSQSVTLGLAI